ncbi:glycoside hydrolase family 13 protein [Metabacillus litoralis]|uniref:glycoside hydrolase family 13 protein n=1 Tax=Metabacillus litoralis TaxID=152268 RepID=UPI0021F50460|nr:glycoside hydrolase family 13 protein [Metabacillus litoralis]
MLREAIYHRSCNNYAYAYDENTLHMMVRCKKNEAKHVSLLYGDPYAFIDSKWDFSKADMVKTGTDAMFDYWKIAVNPHFRRLRYAFEFTSFNNCETFVYTEKGFFDQPPTDDVAYYFCFPFLNKIDVFSPPEWVKNTVWYQIFPDRFANGDVSINPPHTRPWASEDPNRDNFFGGDFQGIMYKVDYLSDLGITGIYFTPIFKAHSNYKYDTIDYMEIDPQFGDKHTFKRLIETCHEHGIKVMLDAVFNHSGYFFDKFQDVVKHGANSSFVNWFHIHEFPLILEPIPNYETFGFVGNMPKLNTENAEVKEYLLKIGRYWVEEFDIDGWRLDVANEVDHQFWREFRQEVKKCKPDIYILGEIWHDSITWLQGDQFDAVMNYPFTDAALSFFAKDSIHVEEFANKIQNVYHMYPQNINEVAFNLLGSHDTPRVLTMCKNNTSKVKMLFTFLLSYIGTPCIYYGDEIGMLGDQDPGCRACMEWNEEKQDQELLNYVKKLITLRKTIPAMGHLGKFDIVEANPATNLLIYTKSHQTQTIWFLMNNSNEELTVPLPHDAPLTNLINSETVQHFVTLSQYEVMILGE